MEDFPPSPDNRPRVPWAKAVRTTATSSQAPGPPTRDQGSNTKKREKTPQKLAATLRGLSASEGSGGESSGERRSGAGSGEQQVNGHTSNDVDGWDPMAQDYQSPSFNSYDRGPGALLKAGQEGNEICLFIDRIPLAITKEGLRNLFSRAGKVMKVHIMKQTNPSKNTTFGFVEFATVREADTALQTLNGFEMGHGVQLVVKISESQANRRQRLAKKREEEAFLNTLNCAKYEGKHGLSEGEDYEMSEKEASKGVQNPFVPRYTPHSGSGLDSPIPAAADSSPTPTSLSSSAGAASLRGQSSPGIPEAAANSDLKVPSPGGRTGNTSLPSSQGPCTVCGKPCSSRCARCKAPYCNAECQQQDWARHKADCHPPGSSSSESPHKESPEKDTDDYRSFQLNGLLKIAETVDDEGFHISTLDDSELDELQSFIQQATAPPQTSGAGSSGMEGKPDSPGSRQEAYASVKQPVSQDVSTPAKQEHSIVSSPTKHVQFADREGLSDHELASDVTTRNTSPEVVIPLSEIMPHFESPAYPLASIPIGAPLPRQFNAVVTAILGVTKFSVIPLSVEAKQVLVRLQQFAREASLDRVNSDELTIGSKCGLYLNQEGFCRVEVTKLPSGSKVAVKRCDLGGQLFIPLDMLSRLPEEILGLPCLRTRCSLVNLWDDGRLLGGAEFLFSQVQGSPVRVQNCGAMALRSRPDIKIVLCRLESADGTVDIYKAVESSQFHKPQKPAMASASPPQLPRQPGKPAVQSPKPGPPSTKPPASPHTPYKMVHFANKVPSHCPPRGCSFKIYPTIVTNPSVIWAHVVHDKIGILYRMQDDLNKKYQNSKNDSYSPTVGEICAAKFSNDQKFYRTEVLCVNHDGTVDIQYVDFGNRETIMVGQLRHLAPIFLSLPKQALQFTLAGIKPVGSSWSDGAIACLKEKIMTKKVLVEIVSDAPKTFFVKLFDPESPQKIFNDELVSLGYAVHVESGGKSPRDLPSPLRGVSITHGNVSPSATFPFLKSPPAGRRHVLLPTPAPAREAPVLLPTPAPAPAREAPDSPHDSSWKLQPREKQTKPPQGGGVSSSAPPQLLEPHTPPLSPQPHTDTDTNSISMSWKAPVEKSPPNDPPSLLGSPPKTNSIQLAQQPGMQGYARSKPLSPRMPDIQSPTNQCTPNNTGGLVPWKAEPQRLEKAGQKRPREEPAIQNATHRLLTPRDFEKQQIKSPPMLAEGKSERVLVSHVENPYQFWVQVVDEKSLGTLLECSQKLNKAPLKQASPRAGDSCVCRYSQDGCLYRGRVNSISDTCATVQFIDYGNTEEVSLSDLFEAEPEFLTLPAQAIMCTLNQLLNPKGRGEAWDPAAVDFLRSQCSDDKVISITVIKALGLKHVVDVTISDDSGERNLLELMVESGHGSTIGPKSPSRGRGQQRQQGPFAGSREKQFGTVAGSSEPRRGALWKERPGQGGMESGQGTPWKGKTGQGGMESGQGAPWKGKTGQGGIEPGQGAPWKGKTGQGGIEPGQGAPWKGKTGQGGMEPGQGAPWKGNTEQGGMEPGRGAPWKGKTGQGGMEPGQGAPWKGKPRQGGPSLQRSPSQPAAPQPNQGPTASHSSLPHNLGSPSRAKPSTFSRLRSPQSDQPAPETVPFSATASTQLPHLPRVTSLAIISPPSESDYFEVLASEVHSPLSLFLQVASRSSAQALNKLSTSLNSHLQTHPPAPLAQPPAKGSLCCSKFSQDGMWYRAEVVEIFQGGCVVRFIDFGNTDSVQSHDLAPCPSQFLDTPIMAIQCALKGVSPVRAPQTNLGSGQARWPMEAIAFLKQKCSDRILLAKVVGRSLELGLPLVELVDTSSDKDVSMAAELINAGHATADTAQNTADQVQTSSFTKQPPTQSPPKLTPPDRSPPKPVQISPNAVSASKLSIAPVQLPEDVLFKVQVTDNVDPGCFWVQQIAEDRLSSFMDLMNQLQLVYCDPIQYSGFQPAVGTVCCTRYQVDDCWYRCEVVGLSDNQAKLCYLDFGNIEVVPYDQIYHLDPKFTTLPGYAVRCSLSGVKPVSGTSWTGEAIQKFTNLLSSAEKTLMAKVPPGAAENSPVPLELYSDKSATHSVAMALLESGHARRANAPSLQPGQGPASSAPVGVPLGIPPAVLPAAPEFRALITHTNSLTEFFLQVVTSDIVKTVMAMWEKMNRHCSTAQGFPRPPNPGDLCLAKYDQEWFRAQVLRQTARDSFEVFFIDYGNKEVVSLSLMRPMLGEFLSLPVQVLKCGLYGVPAGEVGHPSTSALEAFSRLTANVSLTCRVACQYPLLVELRDASRAALSVREEMAKLQLFLPIDELGLINLPTNTLPTDGTSVVVVTEVVSPGEFWVQAGEVNTLMELDKMTRKMHEYCKSCLLFTQPPVLGQICCAKFSEDGSWYRARVIHVPSPNSLGVHFIDYGNQEVIPVSELRPFKQEFQYLPAQAIRCCLVGFEGRGAEEAELVRKFRVLVGNRQLVAVHKGVGSEGVATVELVDTSTAKDVYIHKELK